MSTTFESAESSARDRKRPWAALGVLGVAALAIAAAMVHVQTRPVEPHLAVLPDAERTLHDVANPSSPYHVPSEAITQTQNTTTAAPTAVNIGKPVTTR